VETIKETPRKITSWEEHWSLLESFDPMSFGCKLLKTFLLIAPPEFPV
jgi:hypothetical protein